jgi:glycosyltransferase involved in cell wall biosynthesis
MVGRRGRERPLIAFFDYCDVFEDFYPHYGVDQHMFATHWSDTWAHDVLSLVQQGVGDVIWYEHSLSPQVPESRHEVVGCRVKLLRSSWLHRRLWRWFYLSRFAWRWQGRYRTFATVASYAAPVSLQFVKTLWRDRPDLFLVHTHSSGRFDMLLLAARALRAPVVAYHSGGDPENYLGIAAKRWTIPRADGIVACGSEEAEMLTARYGVDADRVAVILAPIDTDSFCPIDRWTACRTAGLDPARRYVLFVGRLQDSVKRIGALIEAFAAVASGHPDVDLVVVGEGPDGTSLRALAQGRAPDRVLFLGWISGPQALAPLYNAAECLVLPSRREGLPTVVGEAAACGTPVLGTRVGGMSELVVDGATGWLIAPGDDEALRKGLDEVLNDPDTVTSMRPRIRKLAEERMASQVVMSELREFLTDKLIRRFR